MFGAAIIFFDENYTTSNHDFYSKQLAFEGIVSTISQSQVVKKMYCIGEVNYDNERSVPLDLFGVQKIDSLGALKNELEPILESGSLLVISPKGLLLNIYELKRFHDEINMYGNDFLILSDNDKEKYLDRPYIMAVSCKNFFDCIPESDCKSNTVFQKCIMSYDGKKIYKKSDELFLKADNPYLQSEIERQVRFVICKEWQRRGVIFEDISTVFIDSSVQLALGVVIGPMTVIKQNTCIGMNTRITAFSWLEETVIGSDNYIWSSTLVNCFTSEGVTIGPYSYLRGDCKIMQNAAVGAHCELNDTVLGESSKCKHFSYLGHANVGSRVNIGAGTITCNYDGTNKYRTSISEGAFIGSNTMLVAPVSIGVDAMTGAGSVVTNDIPSNMLAFGVPSKIQRKCR